VQRELRDHITARAEFLAERINDSSRQARLTAQAAAVEREQHRQRLGGQLAELVELHRRAVVLASQRTVPQPRAAQDNAAHGLELSA
jgi:hypothetical protein